MAQQAPYIPAPDGEFATWLSNFATLIAADPTDYGLVSGDATVITGVNTAYQAAYTAAIDPSTRTPVTVQAKIDARNAAEQTVRPYAVTISRNESVSNELKTGLGINLPNPTRTPVPAPVTSPSLELVGAAGLTHRLQIRDSSTPTSKKKPFGVIGCEIWVAVGTVAAVDPSQASLKTVSTKTPVQLEYTSGDRGKLATYFLRWQTRSGPGGQAQTGPWSDPVALVIP